jgi:hypothetical protein
MHEPLLPTHRTGECTGSWHRFLLSQQAIWQCNGCGFAYPESEPVVGAVRTEEIYAELLATLAADGARILARNSQDLG